MLKIYRIGSHLYQYEEGEQPEGAVEVKRGETDNKAKKPVNKAKKAAVKK